MKIGCLIYSTTGRYEIFQKWATKSFFKYHKDILLFSLNEKSDIIAKVYKKYPEINSNTPIGIFKMYIAAFLFDIFKLDKIIMLGADTITCNRLSEFIEDNEYDILASLDYPYVLQTKNLITNEPYILSSFTKENHVNADVVCFNNVDSIHEVIVSSLKLKSEYHEQAGLNYVCNVLNKFKTKIVDSDFESSEICYNVRSKGNICIIPTFPNKIIVFQNGQFIFKDETYKSNQELYFKYIKNFKIKNDKLYTGTHRNIIKEKQIKVWHFCEAFGCLSDSDFYKKIDNWINQGFNKETKQFFQDQCDCVFN
jgi:hypothetical protein